MDRDDFDNLFRAFYDKNIELSIKIFSKLPILNEDLYFYSIPENPKIILFGKNPFPLLNIAATFGFYEGCKMLLEKGSNVNCTDKYNNSPFHCAASCGNIDILNLLIEYDCDTNSKNKNGDLALHIAASHNQTLSVLYLIEKDKSIVNEKNNFGITAVSIAVANNNLELAQTLIFEHYADVTTIDNKNNTLLHIAASRGSLEVLQFLLSLNLINVNNINLYGQTPLHISASKGNFAIFKLLLSNGSNSFVLDSKQRTIIHHSISSSSFEIFNFIIENKLAFPFQIDDDNNSSFHFAAKIPDVRFIKTLASLNGEQINTVSKNGLTPLHIACKHQFLETVKFIFSSPLVDPLIENSFGQNALHIAARSNNFELLKFLLDLNCYDFSIPDIAGILFSIFIGHHFIMQLKKVH